MLQHEGKFHKYSISALISWFHYFIYFYWYLQLKKEGFTDVDGLDPSQEMLTVAKTKDVFQSYICAFVGKDYELPIEDGRQFQTFLYFSMCYHVTMKGIFFRNEKSSLPIKLCKTTKLTCWNFPNFSQICETKLANVTRCNEISFLHLLLSQLANRHKFWRKPRDVPYWYNRRPNWYSDILMIRLNLHNLRNRGIYYPCCYDLASSQIYSFKLCECILFNFLAFWYLYVLVNPNKDKLCLLNNVDMPEHILSQWLTIEKWFKS